MKKRVSRKVLLKDRDSFDALKSVAGYDPSNTDFTVAKGQTALNGMNAGKEAEVQAEASAAAERDNSAQAEANFHAFVVGAKEQVIAQFGKDSNEVQAVGLKKKSEYKSPTKKNGGTPA